MNKSLYNYKNSLIKLVLLLLIIVTYFSVNSIMFCIFKNTYSYDINKLFSIPINPYLFIIITFLLLASLLHAVKVNKINSKDRAYIVFIYIITFINILGIILTLIYSNSQRISTKYFYGDYDQLYKTIAFTFITYIIINILYYLVNFRRSEKNNADFYCICCIFIVYFIYAFPMLVFGIKYDTHISAFYREFESKIISIDYFSGFYKLGFSIFFILILSIYDIIKTKKRFKNIFIRIILYCSFITILMLEFYYYYHYLFDNRNST